MSLPAVSIVGRPNVGKSTLFNSIIRRRQAIEEPTAGVTRDRISAVVNHQGRAFELLDTGGMGIEDSMGLSEEVERQIQFALEGSMVLVFVVDIRDGVTPLDTEIAQRIRQLEIPIILAANKCDSPKDRLGEGEIFKLGLGEPILCSAKQRQGRNDILDAVVSLLPEKTEDEAAPEPLMKLAVVGRRNVGKSSLINALVKEERVIVSEIPGTTRDAVDVLFQVKGKRFLAIDTAGVRRKKSLANSIEFFSLDRSLKSISRADVVLLIFDVREEIAKIEKQLAAEIISQQKPCILVINKWDLAEGVSSGEYARYVNSRLRGMSFAPLSFISAKTRLNLVRTMELALELYEQAGQRVGTGELNRAVEEIVAKRSPRAQRGKLGKVYYATQVDVHPPTIVLFVNQKSLFADDYLRYVGRSLREKFAFAEVPLRLVLKQSD